MASKGFTIRIPSLNRYKKALSSYPKLVRPKIKEAMKKSIKDIEKATVPITPIDTGKLRKSLKTGQRITATRGVIGTGLGYALYQHETTGLNHPGGGEAKYLETGTQDSMKKIQKNFGLAVDETLKIISKFGD